MKDFLYIAGGFIVVITVAFFICYLISVPIKYIACTNYGANTEREIRFSLLSGCYVKIGNMWFSESDLESVHIYIDGVKYETN